MVSSRVADSKVLRKAIQFEYFFWYKVKKANAMLEILDGFYLEWVLMYRHSKTVFLQVTLNFELE